MKNRYFKGFTASLDELKSLLRGPSKNAWMRYGGAPRVNFIRCLPKRWNRKKSPVAVGHVPCRRQ